MCGIAGFFGKREIADGTVDQCLKLMRQRGPDHAASRRFRTQLGAHVLLLHSRLSIIDVDARANQPFNVGTKWLSYNGELYNYVELAEALRKQGHAFSTSSDTEVLLRAIDTHGWHALDSAEGMWAFALFDTADDTLTLCRDRFGEKPLYLARRPEGVYFASEVKFIFALMERRLPVNRRHLMRYLVNGYKALYKTSENFFDGLQELAPGTLLTLSGYGSESLQRYWTPSFSPQHGMTQEEAVAGCRERLAQAVRIRLRSDVPLAFLMSGGVDSNALISIAKRVFDYDVHGFTIMNDDERYDEREIVVRAAAELGIRHTPVSVSTVGFLERMRDLIRYHDAPVYTITYYVQWLLMQQVAAQGYRIAVSGTGADELFTGYYDHYLMHLAEIRGTPEYASALEGWQTHVRPVVRNPFLGNPDLFVKDAGFRDHVFLNNEGFADYLSVRFNEPFQEETYTPLSVLRNRMMNEMFHESVRVILHEDDLNAMYYSIENRSPFLDRALFDFCYSIPTALLMRDGFNKVILRDALRGIAPDCVLDERRKVGFNAPVHSFLDTQDRAVRSELLADSAVFDIICRDKIVALLEKPDLPNSESKFLFYFVNTKIFLEEFAG